MTGGKPWRNDDADLLHDAAKTLTSNPGADPCTVLTNLARTFRGETPPEVIAERLLLFIKKAREEHPIGSLTEEAAMLAEKELIERAEKERIAAFKAESAKKRREAPA